MKDRHKAVEYEESEEVPFVMPKNPPMPKEIAARAIPSLSLLASVVISSSRASLEDISFMNNVISLPKCPEWTGYNTRRAREAGIIASPKAKVIFRPLINKTPQNPSALNIAIQTGLKNC